MPTIFSTTVVNGDASTATLFGLSEERLNQDIDIKKNKWWRTNHGSEIADYARHSRIHVHMAVIARIPEWDMMFSQNGRQNLRLSRECVNIPYIHA